MKSKKRKIPDVELARQILKEMEDKKRKKKLAESIAISAVELEREVQSPYDHYFDDQEIENYFGI